MKRRYCPMCDDTTNANICDRCGDVTDPWPCDGSVTDQFYQKKAARQRAPENATAPGSPRTPQPDGSAHTPGPWWIFGSKDDERDEEPHYRRYPGIESESMSIVVFGEESQPTGVRGSEEVALANAAFIVRAVNAHDDLLKALKGFVYYFRPEITRDIVKYECQVKVMEAARAAIAKAEAH